MATKPASAVSSLGRQPAAQAYERDYHAWLAVSAIDQRDQRTGVDEYPRACFFSFSSWAMRSPVRSERSTDDDR